ncbi:MAG: hypothetical protein AAFV53_09175 [Myxococcota bacterium]
MSRVRFSCLYPLLLNHESYFRYRFQHYQPSQAFEKLSLDNCPERYRHALHADGILYQRDLSIDSGGLDADWRRLGFSDAEQCRFVHDACGSTLLYDGRYGMFLMDIRLTLDLHPMADGDDPEPVYGLLAAVRRMLVKDPRDDDDITAWAKSIQQAALDIVRHELRDFVEPEIVQVPDSMGYLVVHFPRASEALTDEVYKGIIARYHQNDKLVERVPRMRRLPLSGKGKLFLGWQASTLLNIEDERFDESFPVFFTIQLIYTIYGSYFLAQTEELFEEIFYFDEERFRDLQTRTDRMLILIDKTIHDKNVFESKLRPVQLSAFQSLWEYWGLQKMLDACEHSLHSSKRSLEMNINIIHEKMGERQNNLLFVLAIFQIIAMIGVVNDYLSLSDRFRLLSLLVLAALSGVTIISFVFGYYEKIESFIRKSLGQQRDRRRRR